MMRDANIVTLYKNRPARRDCTNNYQGIESPSIAIKLCARVVVKGLHVLAERFYPESWCGFPAKRSILLGLIACPAWRSIRSVWSRLRRNGHKRYLHLYHLLGGTFQLTQYFFLFRPKQSHLSLHNHITSIIQLAIRCRRALYIPLHFNEGCRLCFEVFKRMVQGE